MGFVAAALLLVCALLTGLTLAICGLDKTLVQLRSVSGTPKERYVGSDLPQQGLLTIEQKTSKCSCPNEASWIMDAM